VLSLNHFPLRSSKGIAGVGTAYAKAKAKAKAKTKTKPGIICHSFFYPLLHHYHHA